MDEDDFVKALESDVNEQVAIQLLHQAKQSNPLMWKTFDSFDMECLNSYLSVIQVSQGTQVIKMGEDASFVLILLQGSMTVRLSSQVEFALPAGSLVGEMAVFEGEKRSADIFAGTDAIVAVLTFEELDQLKAHDPSIAIKLMDLLASSGLTRLRSQIKHERVKAKQALKLQQSQARSQKGSADAERPAEEAETKVKEKKEAEVKSKDEQESKELFLRQMGKNKDDKTASRTTNKGQGTQSIKQLQGKNAKLQQEVKRLKAKLEKAEQKHQLGDVPPEIVGTMAERASGKGVQVLPGDYSAFGAGGASPNLRYPNSRNTFSISGKPQLPWENTPAVPSAARHRLSVYHFEKIANGFANEELEEQQRKRKLANVMVKISMSSREGLRETIKELQQQLEDASVRENHRRKMYEELLEHNRFQTQELEISIQKYSELQEQFLELQGYVMQKRSAFRALAYASIWKLLSMYRKLVLSRETVSQTIERQHNLQREHDNVVGALQRRVINLGNTINELELTVQKRNRTIDELKHLVNSTVNAMNERDIMLSEARPWKHVALLAEMKMLASKSNERNAQVEVCGKQLQIQFLLKENKKLKTRVHLLEEKQQQTKAQCAQHVVRSRVLARLKREIAERDEYVAELEKMFGPLVASFTKSHSELSEPNRDASGYYYEKTNDFLVNIRAHLGDRNRTPRTALHDYSIASVRPSGPDRKLQMGLSRSGIFQTMRASSFDATMKRSGSDGRLVHANPLSQLVQHEAEFLKDAKIKRARNRKLSESSEDKAYGKVNVYDVMTRRYPTAASLRSFGKQWLVNRSMYR